MGRLFNDAASEYAEFAGAPVTAMPLSMACWFRPDAVGIDGTLICIDDGASSNNSMYRLACGGSGGDKVRANLRESLGTEATAVSTTTIANGRWDHAAGVFTSSTSRDCFHNGAKTSNGTTINPATPSRTRIGALELAATGRIQYWSGDIAEAAIWNVALTDAEIAALARGVSPLLIRPGALVHYWPLIGRTSPEIDIKGAAPLTLSGTSASAHPRVINPRRRQAYSVAGGGGATDVPVSDTGSGSEAPTVAAAVPVADTGAGSDAPTVAAAAPVSDTGSGSDAPSIAAAVPVADAGAGSDAPAVAASVSLADVAAGVEAIGILVSVDVGDAGSGSEGSVPGIGVDPGDTGSGVESLAIAAAVPVADTGRGTDGVSVPEGSPPTPSPRGVRFTTPSPGRWTTPGGPRFTERSA